MTLDAWGYGALVTALVFAVPAALTAANVSRSVKFALTGAFAAWVGAQFALAEAGFFASAAAQQVPLVGLMVAAPPLFVGVAALVSARIREALLGLPPALLVALNIGRVFGGFFLLLESAGRLGGPFPFFAGWGDILTGAAAVPLAVLASRGQAAGALRLWNLFGAADLLLAVTLGTLSSEGFAFQLIHAAPGSEAVQQLPWLLIPTALVPFYLILHGVIAAQLRRSAALRPATPAVGDDHAIPSEGFR